MLATPASVDVHAGMAAAKRVNGPLEDLLEAVDAPEDGDHEYEDLPVKAYLLLCNFAQSSFCLSTPWQCVSHTETCTQTTRKVSLTRIEL